MLISWSAEAQPLRREGNASVGIQVRNVNWSLLYVRHQKVQGGKSAIGAGDIQEASSWDAIDIVSFRRPQC